MKHNSKAVQQVAAIIISVYGYTVDDLVRQDRKKGTVEARNAFCFLLRKYLNMSYNDIGSILHRDHSSVANAIRMFQPDELLEKLKLQDDALFSLINSPNYQVEVSNTGKWTRVYRDRGGVCEIPGCGFDDVLEIHHLVPKKSGGTDDLSNLIILCPNHHAMLHHGLVQINARTHSHIKIT